MMTLPISRKYLDQRSYFFDQGIRFTCKQCGACCVGEPGTIYVSASEIIAVTRHLDTTKEDFINHYCYQFKDGYSIREDARGRCLFFDDGCTIYPVRPLQCRTFPFWFSNMRSEQRWSRVKRHCPGIGSGRLYSRDEILSISQSTMHF